MTTMISPLRRATQVAPRRPAVRCGEVSLTYAEMWDRCRRLVGGLRGLGVEEATGSAIVSPNCHRYLELYQAVPAAGLVIVPLNQRHSDAELRYALEDSGAKVLFAGRPVGDLPDCVSPVIDMGDGVRGAARRRRAGRLPRPIGEEDLAGLFYTGGTTGAAKGVMLTHRNLVANAMHIQAMSGRSRRRRAGCRRAAVRRRGFDRRALDDLERAAASRCCPRSTPAPRWTSSRASASPHARRAEHARGDGRRAARAAARRLLARARAAAARRRRPRRCAAPTRRSPAPPAARLRRDGAAPIATLLPASRNAARLARGALVRPAGGRRRGRGAAPGGAARRRRGGRGRRPRAERDGRVLEQAGGDRRRARRRLVPHRRSRLHGRDGSSTSSTARRT